MQWEIQQKLLPKVMQLDQLDLELWYCLPLIQRILNIFGAGSNLEGIIVTFDLSNPFVVVGLLVGGMLPYLFGSMGMQAVGRAGGAVVIELEDNLKNTWDNENQNLIMVN